MEYKGKLYGKFGKDRYVPLLMTSEDVDALQERVKELESRLQSSSHTGTAPENDMTAEQFFNDPGGMFTLDFLSEEERQTIYKAIDLFVKGKLRMADRTAPNAACQQYRTEYGMCPKCNGSGRIFNTGTSSSIDRECDYCNGTKTVVIATEPIIAAGKEVEELICTCKLTDKSHALCPVCDKEEYSKSIVKSEIAMADKNDMERSEVLYEFLSSDEKPFKVDVTRKLFNKYYREEITLSRLNERLNEIVFYWHTACPSSPLPVNREGWIRVEDGLPDIHQVAKYSNRVLCLTNTGKIEVGYLSDGIWARDNGHYFSGHGYTITHWQPLPSPPKTDKIRNPTSSPTTPATDDTIQSNQF